MPGFDKIQCTPLGCAPVSHLRARRCSESIFADARKKLIFEQGSKSSYITVNG